LTIYITIQGLEGLQKLRIAIKFTNLFY